MALTPGFVLTADVVGATVALAWAGVTAVADVVTRATGLVPSEGLVHPTTESVKRVKNV